MSQTLTTFDSDASIDDIIAVLRRDGGVIVRDLASTDLMDEVYAEVIGNSSEADRETTGTEVWPEGNRTIGGLPALSPLFVEELALHPKVLEIVDAMLLPAVPMAPNSDGSFQKFKTDGQYLPVFVEMMENDEGGKQLVARETDPVKGPNCHHYNVGASVLLEVHKGGENQFLHRENGIYQPYISHIHEMREFIVSVNWAGSDFTVENGATRVVPGSHEWPEDRMAKEAEVAQAVMSKGSALLWLSRTLHGAGASTSSEGRPALFHSFVADWFRQEENQYLTVPPEIAEKLSQRGRQLIGYRASPTLGWVKGRSGDNLLEEGSSSPI